MIANYEPRKIMYFRDGDSAPLFGTAIRHEGKLWLVPWWNEGPTEGTRSPARIICLSSFAVGSPTPTRSDADLILSRPLNRLVLEGQSEGQNPLVIEQPKIVLNVAGMP
jgi:hypothetical protein